MKALTREAKISAVCHGAAVAALAALLAVCAFYDLQISKAVSNADSFYGALFAILGEWPAYLIVPLCSVLLFYNAKRLGGRKSIAFMTISAAMCFGGLLLWNINGEKLVEMPFKWGFAVFYSIIWTAILLYFGRFIKPETVEKLFKFAVFAITVAVATVIIINVLKLCWGRMRFRDMLAAGSFEGFTTWYSPQGVRRGGDFTSFPSGHTASAANIFIITALPQALGLKNAARKTSLLYAASLAFAVLTAFSRVVFNAHFLSDTIAGGAVSYAVFYAAKKLFFKDGNYVFQSKVNDEQ